MRTVVVIFLIREGQFGLGGGILIHGFILSQTAMLHRAYSAR